jgi:hypothetical protein
MCVACMYHSSRSIWQQNSSSDSHAVLRSLHVTIVSSIQVALRVHVLLVALRSHVLSALYSLHCVQENMKEKKLQPILQNAHTAR